MNDFLLALDDKRTGKYYNSSTHEYFLVVDNKVMATYKPSGNEDKDREIESMLWKRILATTMDFNPTIKEL